LAGVRAGGRTRWIAPIAAIAFVLLVVAAAEGDLRPTGSDGLVDATTRPSSGLPPLGLNITFAANTSTEVGDLVNDSALVRPGDSFDLASGNPQSYDPLNVTQVEGWILEIHSAYPNATLYVQTAGFANYAALGQNLSEWLGSNATLASIRIGGLLYDYEPAYEPEFNANFSPTLVNLENASRIAHSFSFASVGYLTGRAITRTHFPKWNYAKLGEVVDELFVQTQRSCLAGNQTFEQNVSKVLSEYRNLKATDPPPAPTFQITLGPDINGTPNGVRSSQAYGCAQVLVRSGLSSLYLWFNPASNAFVKAFLQDLGRGAGTRMR
jgi:hypothetical protein